MSTRSDYQESVDSPLWKLADDMRWLFPHVEPRDIREIIQIAISEGELVSLDGPEVEKLVNNAYGDGSTDGRDQGMDERDNDWETALSYALEGVDSYLDDITDIVVSCEEYEEVKTLTEKIHNLIEGMQP